MNAEYVLCLSIVFVNTLLIKFNVFFHISSMLAHLLYIFIFNVKALKIFYIHRLKGLT